MARRPGQNSRGDECMIDSSCIADASYDNQRSTLSITFHTGRSYVYSGVSPQRYKAFCDAGSKGRYFNALIRNVYPYRRIG
jgi:lysyl-tRNA synthetase class 2